MAVPHQPRRRVLAIDPTARGFGFVVFEGPDRLLDWGVPEVSGEKNSASLLRITSLIRRYDPSALVIEDHRSRLCKRGARARKLLVEIGKLSITHRVLVHRISIRTVRRAFADLGVAAKYPVAAALASRYEQLTPLLPPRRKPWRSEHERMGIFDAAAFAVAYFDPHAHPIEFDDRG